MITRTTSILLILLVATVVACQAAEPETITVKETVEVTRLVEVPAAPPEAEVVEVTRVVEMAVDVEVTRVVEVPVEQAPPEAPSLNPMMPVEFATLSSSSTSRDYAITVVLPMSYMMTDVRYPVVYVTDGDFYAFPLAVAAGQLAFGQEIPEFIVVGVDYGTPNPMDWLELRELDMGPEGREKFQGFFEEELIPYIESTYRADSANRTLMGHSSGGDFALYGLLSGTGTFSNFVASSPGLAAGLIDAVEDFAANQSETPARLYLSVGELDAEVIIAGVEALDEALTGAGIAGLDHESTILGGETHLSARPRAFNNGMRWLFAGGAE